MLISGRAGNIRGDTSVSPLHSITFSTICYETLFLFAFCLRLPLPHPSCSKHFSNGAFSLSYSGEQDPPTLLSVIDQNGRPISTLSLSGTVGQQVTLLDLPSGIYWVQLKTQGGKVGVKQLQIVKR